MASAGTAEETGIEGKLVNGKRQTAEESITLEVLADLTSRGLLEAGQGDVRAKLAVIRCQAKLKEAGGDLALQQVEGFISFDSGPDNAGLAARGKEADSLQLQRKLWHCYLGQGLADVEEGGAVDFTDETESEMELLGWGPAGVGQSAAEQGQVIADVLRWVDGDEEAFVHGWWG